MPDTPTDSARAAQALMRTARRDSDPRRLVGLPAIRIRIVHTG
jgi:hypothetical protein